MVRRQWILKGVVTSGRGRKILRACDYIETPLENPGYAPELWPVNYRIIDSMHV